MNKGKETYIIPEAEIWEFEQVSMGSNSSTDSEKDESISANVLTRGVYRDKNWDDLDG